MQNVSFLLPLLIMRGFYFFFFNIPKSHLYSYIYLLVSILNSYIDKIYLFPYHIATVKF